MNSFIETSNQSGENYLSFAWPMFWQSSLLIVGLFVFDFWFRRKLRASIRYALWLVVLVKLCAPPTLALPTSPAWWLHKTPPPVAAIHETHYTVTYADTALPEISQGSPPVFIPPKPAMTLAAWSLVFSTLISGALLAWLLVRWWQITRQVRRAKTSERLTRIAAEAQKIAGLTFKVRVKLTTNSMSPAACGLFRPAILIPQLLVENFSDEQLRAVLLHELIHLRRRDVWLNFLQALLQIVYWWHPLVWLANARIRRVREEAVDDAVMLALRDEAESYAPTLVEVAKLALNRPLASLDLVGIMESHRALRQRIERLVDFRPPRKAGLTLVSMLGILAFTAVAVPMGGGPGPVETHTFTAPAVSPSPALIQKTSQLSVLVSAQFYQMRPEDFKSLVSDLQFNQGRMDEDSCWSASPEGFSNLLAGLKSSGFKRISAPRVQTGSGEAAEVYVGNGTNGIWFDCTPVVNGGLVNLAVHGKVIDTDGNMTSTNQFRTSASVDDFGGLMVLLKNMDGLAASNLMAVIGVRIITTNVVMQQNEKPKADRMVQDAKLFYEMGKLNEAELKLKAALALDSENASAEYYLGLVQAARQSPNVIKPAAGRQAIMQKLKTIRLDRVAFDATPLGEVIRSLSVETKKQDPDRQGINFLLNPNQPGVTPKIDRGTGLTLATNAVPAADLRSLAITISPGLTNNTLGDALDALVKAAPEPIHYSVEDYGIAFSPGPSVFYIRTNAATNSVTMTFKLNPIGSGNLKKLLLDAGVTNPPTVYFYKDDDGRLLVRGSPEQLALVNRLVLKLNGHPTNEIAEGDKRFGRQTGTNGFEVQVTTNLLTRTFRLDPNKFIASLKKAAGAESNSVPMMAKKVFKTLGVDLELPGKAVFYNDRLGELLVRGTQPDLDMIERLVEMLNMTAPQIHIKARFVEVTQDGKQPGFDWYLGQFGSNNAVGTSGSSPSANVPLSSVNPLGIFHGQTASNGVALATATITGILSEPDFHIVLHALESRPGFKELAEPEATTVSGRRVQMRDTETVSVVTNFTVHDTSTNPAVTPQLAQVETGPILDVVPVVLSDGYTINLTARPSLTEFLGYDKPTNATTSAYTKDGVKVDVPAVLPRFNIREVNANLNLWDGQTIVLGNLHDEVTVGGKKVDAKPDGENKEVLVFITVTIVDPAGNRVHSDEEMPFAQKASPPPPAQPK